MIEYKKLETIKKQLCDKINSCTSLEEVERWEKVFSYYDVLCDDFDWDYSFLINLIEYKLKRMSNYFHTHGIVEDEDKLGDICDKLISILNAGYKTEIILSKDLNTYVNTRNIYRFFTPKEVDVFIKKDYYLKKYYLATVRETKAKALFWKYLYHNIERLWE